MCFYVCLSGSRSDIFGRVNPRTPPYIFSLKVQTEHRMSTITPLRRFAGIFFQIKQFCLLAKLHLL